MWWNIIILIYLNFYELNIQFWCFLIGKQSGENYKINIIQTSNAGETKRRKRKGSYEKEGSLTSTSMPRMKRAVLIRKKQTSQSKKNQSKSKERALESSLGKSKESSKGKEREDAYFYQSQSKLK